MTDSTGRLTPEYREWLALRATDNVREERLRALLVEARDALRREEGTGYGLNAPMACLLRRIEGEVGP